MAGPIKISVITNASQAQRDLNGVSKAAGGIGSKLGSAGRKAGSLFGQSIKVGAVTAVAAAGGVLGVALTQGFKRLDQIDQAKAKLKGLGHSGGEVKAVMNDALASVKGTAFGLGDAATVAAGTIAAGVKPGRELQRTLKLVADSATISGQSLGEMGAIFNKVATSNKIQGDTINQLNDAGIPIVQLLAKTLHKSSDEVVDLASKGKINFAQFQKAMQAGLGGAALQSGNTFQGAFANLKASLGRIGAGLLGGAFKQLPATLSGVTTALAPLETAAAGLGAKVGKFLAPAMAALPGLVSRGVSALTSLDFSKIGGGSGGLSSVVDGVKRLGSAFAGIDFGQLGTGAGKTAGDTLSVFSVVVKAAAAHTGLLAKVLPALVVAYGAAKTAEAASRLVSISHVPITIAQIAANRSLAASNLQLAAQLAVSTGAENVATVSKSRGVIATVASTTASIAAGAAAKVMAAGQWLLNAALSANPIGIVVLAIAALVAGFIYAYKHCETFRNIVNAVFGFIRTFVVTVVGAVVNFVKNHWQLLVAIIAGPLGIIVGLVVKNWGKIKAFVSTAVAVVKAVVSVGFNALKGIVARAFAAVVTAVVTAVNRVANAVRTIRSRITGALGNVGQLLYNAGKAIIQGLINGIVAMAGRVKDAVKGVFNAAKKLIPNSPAKEGPFSGRGWTLYSGHAISNDLAKGIEQRTGVVRSAAATLARAAVPAVNDAREALTVGALDARTALNATTQNTMTLEVRITAEQLSQLQRGKLLQADLEALAKAGGRPRG